MTRNREPGTRVLPTLIAGFALLVGLLVASAYIGIEAIEAAESDAARSVAGQRTMLHRIEEVQRVQELFNSVFYSLASAPRQTDRPQILKRLDELEAHIAQVVSGAAKSGDAATWANLREAARSFIAEGRLILRSSSAPSEAFFARHEILNNALTAIVSSAFDASAAMEKGDAARSLGRVRYSLLLLGVALTVAVAAAVLTVYMVHQMFRRLRWQAAELALVSSRSMSDQEETARRFSRELHDEFGQTLNATEANLVSMYHARRYDEGRLEDCLGLIRDAIEKARELSQLLRPSILDDFGLDASLQWLARTFSERTNIEVQYESRFSGRLDANTETQLFRIAQEALTNVARHANASRVRLELKAAGQNLRMTVADNGRGLPPTAPRQGLGLVCMRARARDARGVLNIESPPGRGVTVVVELPLAQKPDAQKDPHLVGG